MEKEFEIYWTDKPMDKDFHEYRRQSGIQPPHQNESYIFIKNNDDTLVGGSHLSFNYDFMVIESIWVSNDYKRQGLGIRLFNEIEEHAKKKACEHILLSTLSSMQALSFWEKVGFKIIGEVPDCPKGDMLIYLKKNLQ
jgi:ribosomal protein S18 acetylase RimI-like enzyme